MALRTSDGSPIGRRRTACKIFGPSYPARLRPEAFKSVCKKLSAEQRKAVELDFGMRGEFVALPVRSEPKKLGNPGEQASPGR